MRYGDYPLRPTYPSHIHHPRLRDRHSEIAYTTTWRGDNDEIPTLLFAGAGYKLLKKVLTWFVQRKYMISGCSLYLKYRPYQRVGKVSIHEVVELHGFDSHLCSLDDFCLMIEKRLLDECWCNVTRYSLNRFVNL